jgi:hypothetical protein
MRHVDIGVAGVLAMTVVLGAVSPGAQNAGRTGGSPAWKVPRAPDGHPDLQGIWANATLTPLERPPSMADRRVLTEAGARYQERKIK